MLVSTLQISEKVRLTTAAVERLIKSEKDQQANLMPGDLAEIIEIGEKEHAVDLHSTDLNDNFRLPEGVGHTLLLSRVKKGDRVDVSLPMTTRLERMPDKSNYYAVLHGPIVLAAVRPTRLQRTTAAAHRHSRC